MRSIPLPPDLEKVGPRFKEWVRQHAERALRPRTERTVGPMAAYDSTDPSTIVATSYRVRHNLPHVPTGWRIVRIDVAAQIYEYKAPDRHYLYLRSDTADVTVTIEIA